MQIKLFTIPAFGSEAIEEECYETSEGKGLPIGNLTSQYFANHYLAVGDHYIKERLHAEAMVRYMDDILLFSDNKEQLLSQINGFQDYARQELCLELHHPVINKVCFGVLWGTEGDRCRKR